MAEIKKSNSNAEMKPFDSTNVRVIGPSEYKEAAYALAEAFANDDVARYFIDTPDRAHWSDKDKWDLHVSILEYITYAHCLKGLVTTAGEDYGCVALWMPPGRNMDDLLTIIRSGMWRLNYKLSAEGKTRFFHEFLPLLHDTKHDVLGLRDADSYYLVYIGTRPAARGKGLARKTIEFVTKKADEEGRACYLESSNDVNPIIYGKLGFEVVEKIKMTRAEKEVVLDIMVREPVGHVSTVAMKQGPMCEEKEKFTENKAAKLQIKAGIPGMNSCEKVSKMKAYAVVNTEHMAKTLEI